MEDWKKMEDERKKKAKMNRKKEERTYTSRQSKPHAAHDKRYIESVHTVDGSTCRRIDTAHHQSIEPNSAIRDATISSHARVGTCSGTALSLELIREVGIVGEVRRKRRFRSSSWDCDRAHLGRALFCRAVGMFLVILSFGRLTLMRRALHAGRCGCCKIDDVVGLGSQWRVWGKQGHVW
ncbi:hypothetical protein BKA80DRAFT_77145 [Phyllosticta citrichinensis]